MKEDRPLIVLGSARKDSDTRKLVHQLFAALDYELLDLLDYKIHPYNYSATYPAEDGFLSIIQRLSEHSKIVFATPVYWYAMSGLMKTFFDRLTDLTTINKEVGRQLRGKETYMVSVGADDALPEGFDVPFRLTSAYFDMNFVSGYYCKTTTLSTKLTGTEQIIRKLKAADSKS